MGRPKEARPEKLAILARHKEAIIEWIAQGETLRQWCRDNGIHYSTVYLWMEKDEEFRQRFARARDIGTDIIADNTLALIDEEPERIEHHGGSKIDPGYVQWQRNRVEQRMKLLAKWNPKRYGDKLETTLQGPGGGPVQLKADVTLDPADAYLRMCGKA